MTRYTLSAICFAVMVQYGTTSLAQENNFQMLTYDIFSEGKNVGDMTLKLAKDEKRYVIIEQSHIKASGWWWNLDIITVLSEEFEQDGVLKKSDGKTLDEDSVYWTQISALKNQYQADFTEIVNTTNQEKNQFSKLSFAVAGRVSENTDKILSLSKSMFANREEQVQSAKFPQDAFDTTWNNLPFFVQEHIGKALPDKLNILDSENLEIVQVNLSDLGHETLSIGSKEIQARHLMLSDGKFRPTHLWIYNGTNVDEASLPYFIRYTGEDEDGTFEIVLKRQ